MLELDLELELESASESALVLGLWSPKRYWNSPNYLLSYMHVLDSSML